jgi:hypothetical protein
MGDLGFVTDAIARAGLLGQWSIDQLVPGDPGEPEAFAKDLQKQSETFISGRDAVTDVTVAWEGDAAEAFRRRQGMLADGWNDAAEHMRLARNAVVSYADALVRAKNDAGEATVLFEEGMAQAATAHAAIYTTTAEAMVPLGITLPPYSSPDRATLDGVEAGRTLRDQAVADLVSARKALAAEGDACAATLKRLSDPMPWSSSGLGGLAGTPGTDGDPSGEGPHDPLLGPVPLDDAALQNDVFSQGQLGDCWFLAGAGSVADADPDWVREHIRQNADGSYTVTMYDDGEAVDVRVEASVIDHGARGTDGQPSWISIYEKAAAQQFGGDYGDIEGDSAGRGLEMMTGRDADKHGDPDLEDIRDGLADGRIYTVSTETGPGSLNPFDDEVDDDRVVPNHAYMIDDVRTNADGELEVHVVNPWGPDGGSFDDTHRDGDMWLTEDQLHGSFDDVYSVSGR